MLGDKMEVLRVRRVVCNVVGCGLFVVGQMVHVCAGLNATALIFAHRLDN